MAVIIHIAGGKSLGDGKIGILKLFLQLVDFVIGIILMRGYAGMLHIKLPKLLVVFGRYRVSIVEIVCLVDQVAHPKVSVAHQRTACERDPSCSFISLTRRARKFISAREGSSGIKLSSSPCILKHSTILVCVN
jgi:hypothetical protein